MLRVGLTGGIACGKSHVLRGLARAGLGALDLDVIGHELLAADAGVAAEVVEAFGRGVVDAGGGIDRKALGALVFADGSGRARLNAILHPRIRAVEEERTRELGARAGVVVTDGALLVESGGHLRFDRLVVVHCPEEMQVARLRRRDGLSAGEARQRLEAQMPTLEKRRFASFEVDTSGTPAETDGQVAELVAQIRTVAAEDRGLARFRLDQVVACLESLPEEGPRGLRPREVLRRTALSRRWDLAEIAGWMVPRPTGAWYEAPGERAPEMGAHVLAVVVALWCLGLRGLDADFTLAATAATARLTHRDPESLRAACLVGEAVVSVATAGQVPVDWRERLGRWRREARKWGGGETAGGIEAALDAAARHARDAGAARREAGGEPGSAAVAGALIGLTAGREGGRPAAEDVRETCRALCFV